MAQGRFPALIAKEEERIMTNGFSMTNDQWMTTAMTESAQHFVF
jgi:hypothetical protein